MLAYRVNRHNMKSIAIRNGGDPVELKDFPTYFIAGGEDFPAEVVTEPEFYNRYQIVTRLSRKEGRYVVEKKATAPSPGNARKV